MPPLEYANQYDAVVYWPYLRVDGYGEVVVGAPEQRVVRYDDGSRDTKDPQGQRVTIDASVQTSADMALNSLLWLGTLWDWTQTGVGTGNDTTIFKIITKNEQTDLKDRYISREYGMQRYKGKLPS